MTFRNVPDYEKPADSGRDNVIQPLSLAPFFHTLCASRDGRYYGYLEVTVTVPLRQDVNAATPAIPSYDQQHLLHTCLSIRHGPLHDLYRPIMDPHHRSAITWSLSGADADDFAISETGVLSFASPPDYESPTDSGRDNVYEVTVQARDDSFNPGTLQITITVINLTD